MSSNYQDISLGDISIPFTKGAHMCMIYRNEAERQNMISKFLEAGLRNYEKIDYFADIMTPDEVRAWLKELGLDFHENKQLSVSAAITTYCPDGKFVPEDMLKRLCKCYDQSIADGFSGDRITGETNWLLRNLPGTERFIEYEALINTIIDTHPGTILCQYDATKFDGGKLFDILQVHPLMLINGQVVKNPAYIRTEDFLKEYRSRK